MTLQSRELEAARQPTDIPRNVASKMMFVKNVRKATVLPNHRMQASSKKSNRKLTKNNRRYGCVSSGVIATSSTTQPMTYRCMTILAVLVRVIIEFGMMPTTGVKLLDT